MFSFIPTPYNWIAAAVLALALTGAGAAGSYYVTHNVDKAKLEAVQLADSKAQTASVTASLSQLQGFISTMHGADADYQGALATIAANSDALKKEFSNATVKALPADCRPDAGRLRVLTDAVAATRRSATPAK